MQGYAKKVSKHTLFSPLVFSIKGPILMIPHYLQILNLDLDVSSIYLLFPQQYVEMVFIMSLSQMNPTSS